MLSSVEYTGKHGLEVDNQKKCRGKAREGWGRGGADRIHVWVLPYWGVGIPPPLTVAPPTHFPQEWVGFIISCGMCVSGKDDVGTFGGC